MHALRVGAGRYEARDNRIRSTILGRENDNASEGSATLAARPLAARGDGRRHRDRELRLAEPGLACNEREFAAGDAAGPQPLDWLGLHVRRASRDQLGAAGGLVGLLG